MVIALRLAFVSTLWTVSVGYAGFANAGLPVAATPRASFCDAPWGSVVSSLATLHATNELVTLCVDNSGGFDSRGPLSPRCAVWNIETRKFAAVLSASAAAPAAAQGAGAAGAASSATIAVTPTTTGAAIGLCVGSRCQKLDAPADAFVDGVSADSDAVFGSVARNMTGTSVVVTAKGGRTAMVFDGTTGAQKMTVTPKLKRGELVDNVAAFDEFVAVRSGLQWQFFTNAGAFAFSVKGELGAYAPLRVGAANVLVTDVTHRVEIRDSKNHRVTWRVALPQLDLPGPEKTCACTVAFGQLAAGGGMPAAVNAVTATPDGRIIVVSQRGLALLEPATRRARTFGFPSCVP